MEHALLRYRFWCLPHQPLYKLLMTHDITNILHLELEKGLALYTLGRTCYDLQDIPHLCAGDTCFQ